MNAKTILSPLRVVVGNDVAVALVTALVTAAALTLSTDALAHRPFMVPSTTVLSGGDDWVTVDAAVSNDLFYYNHQPLNVDTLAIVGPDGSSVKAENAVKGKFRNTFDVHLTAPGTYRITSGASFVMASYEVDGERKRWRGTPETFAKEVPANAEKLEVAQGSNRVETFVTSGKPTTTAFKATGVGLELQPVTHPNDLVSGETASFRLLLDGKPAADVKVVAVPGATRYRDRQQEIAATTDADGRFSFRWPEPGLWWINAATRDNRTSVPQAKERRASYAATLEVMPN